MKHIQRPPDKTKRRTTLTLPQDALRRAEQIAHTRKVTLSSVISEALAEGLRATEAAARSNKVLESYKVAFSGFSDDEMAILDGVLLARTEP